MKEKTYKRLWACVQLTLFVVPIIISVWYVPYKISYEQHLVDTVNERAIEFVPANQTVTDFTQAEIMDNDAKEIYEKRVWKLENPELYYFEAIILGLSYGLIIQMLLEIFVWIKTKDIGL